MKGFKRYSLNRQKHRHTDTQTHRHTDRQTDTQTDRHDQKDYLPTHVGGKYQEKVNITVVFLPLFRLQ